MRKNHNGKPLSQGWFMLAVTLGVLPSLSLASSLDGRIQKVVYRQDQVIPLQSTLGYQTQVVFGEGEQIQGVSMGDSLAWQAVPVRHYLFMKPVAPSKTNMTVVTNLHSYTFQLKAVSEGTPLVYKMIFVYPSKEGLTESFNTATLEPSQLNLKYSFSGSKALAPLKAFDDGRFTYFQFKEGQAPAVFQVDANQKEAVVNYHMQGALMVVHGVNAAWTLRQGDQASMVFNEAFSSTESV